MLRISTVLLAVVSAGPVGLMGAAASPATSTPAPETAAFGLLARMADALEHELFPNNTDSHYVHWMTCGLIVVITMLVRRGLVHGIFLWLKKLAERTTTTLDDKLLPALEGPVASLVMVLGLFAAVSVFRFSPEVDRIVGSGFNIAFIGVAFWAVLCAGGAILDHAQDLAHGRQLSIATFMPLIKKTLAALIIAIGLLTLAQSFGADVKAFLAGLGIGGLAVAFAAQDTIANLFGSFVVVLDQPFKVGETVKIGASTGTVEDIGLRSTKIRLVDRSLAILPNKMVAAEPITNLSRFTERRVEHTIGLTYDTTPAQMRTMVAGIRALLQSEAEIDRNSINVFFRDYSESSLDIWIAYVVSKADFANHMELRQRVNLAIMDLAAAQKVSFAFPTQTMHLPETVVERLGAVSSKR
ncbi:MAG TPA: mechanosensitive ion channel family protein [Candidatus Didemnitutus sp.]|nr:mechanosensitive ion channel family protein [Candidatus Didemnitutus sp.]